MYKRQERVSGIIAALKDAYPDPVCALQYKKDYELMIAVRLSAQCTDERVNKITPALFARFPTPVSYTHLDVYKRQACAFRGRCFEPSASAKI